MLSEQIGKSLAWVVDAHFHDCGIGANELAASLDLAQRRDHGVRIFGELDRAGVGKKLARARQREADHDREQPSHRDQHHRDQNSEHSAAGALAVAVAAAAATGAPSESALEQDTEDKLGKERDYAGDYHGDH